MLELRTLGVVELRHAGGGRIESVLLRSKRLSLLAYLCACYPPRLHRRDTLVAVFWPEFDEPHARGALRHELWELRRALGAGVIRGDGAEMVGVDHERLWCDVQVFETALDENRPGDALALWHGEFLPGLHGGSDGFDRWLDEKRDHLARRAVEGARRLIADADGIGDAAGAVSWARRLTELAPYDESSWQCLMVILDRSGDRAGALAAFSTLTHRLRDDLEIEPSPETQALAQRIRSRAEAFAGALEPTPPPGPGRGGTTSRPVPRPPVVIRLAPVENRTGDPAFDLLADRLTDRLARGLSGLDYIQLARGGATTKADAIVSGTLYGTAEGTEVRTCLLESGGGERVLQVPEALRLHDPPDEGDLETVVVRLLVGVHARFDPSVGAGSDRLPFKLPAWESFQESARGAELFGNGRFEDAARHFRRAYELDREHVNAGIFGGIAMSYAGDPVGAESFVTAVMTAAEPLPDYERYFGEWILAHIRGCRPEAYRAAMEATHFSRHPATCATAAREALFMNRPREALRLMQGVPLDEGWWRNWAEIWEGCAAAYHLLGDHTAELEAVLEGRARLPEALPLIRAEARARAALGESGTAISLVQEALTLPPSNAPPGSPMYATPAQVAWVAAQELEVHGQPGPAAEAHQAALGWLEHRAEPTRADRLLRIRILLESGEKTRAQQELLDVASSDDPESLALLGLVAAAHGDTADARDAADRLEQLGNPYLHGRHLLLSAGVRAALGDADAALETLRRAFASGLPFGVEWHALPILRPLAARSDFAELLRPRG